MSQLLYAACSPTLHAPPLVSRMKVAKLQASVYDSLPPITATIDYVTGLKKKKGHQSLSAKGQVFAVGEKN